MVCRQGFAKERTQNIEMRMWGSCLKIYIGFLPKQACSGAAAAAPKLWSHDPKTWIRALYFSIKKESRSGLSIPSKTGALYAARFWRASFSGVFWSAAYSERGQRNCSLRRSRKYPIFWSAEECFRVRFFGFRYEFWVGAWYIGP